MATITRAGTNKEKFVGESFGEFKARQKAKVKARRAGMESIAKRLSKTRDPKQVKALSEIVGLKVSQPEIVEVVSREKTSRGERITGFTRADIVKREALKEKARIAQSEAIREFKLQTGRQIVRDLPSSQVIRGITSKQDAFVGPRKPEEFKPTTSDVIRLVEETKRGEFRGQQVQVGEFKSGDIQVIEETFGQKILRNIGKVDRSVSKNLSLGKLANKLEDLNKKETLKLLQTAVPGKPGKFINKVSTNIITDILRKPVTNAALIGVSAGASKLIGTVGLKYAKFVGNVAKKSPKTAKILGITTNILGKGTGAVIGTVYATSVIKEGLEEKAKTGSIDKTTAKAIRELMLFSIGSKLGTSVKTQKLTQLQKEFNKLPVSQQKALQNRLNKISKASPKDFKAKDLGITKQLDRLQIKKSIVNGRIQEDVLLVTKNNLFFVKKGNIPKKTKSFFVDVVGVKSEGVRGIKVNSQFKARVKVKFNPKTGKLESLGKPVSFKTINVREANALLKRIKPGVVKRVREVGVSAFEKKIVKGVKVTPKVKITKKKIIKGFQVKPAKKKIIVKEGKRRITELLEAKLDVKSKKLGKLKRVENLVFKKEKLEFLQFTPIKTPKKPVKSKIPKIPKKPSKIDQLFIIGEKGALVLKKKPSLVTVKKIVKKPVLDVKIVGEGKNIKLFPLKPISIVKKPSIKKIRPKIKPRTKPKTITKAKVRDIIKPQSIFKPKIGVTPISKGKPKIKGIVKPKSKIIIKGTQISKPKVAVKQALVQKQKIRRPFLKKVKVKFPKIKIPIFKFKTKTKTLASKKKKGVKPTIKLFTPTILRPKKKKTLFIPTTEIVSGLERR